MEHDLFQGAKKMSTPLHLSVAVPVHNEEAVLPELLPQVGRMRLFSLTTEAQIVLSRSLAKPPIPTRGF